MSLVGGLGVPFVRVGPVGVAELRSELVCHAKLILGFAVALLGQLHA